MMRRVARSRRAARGVAGVIIAALSLFTGVVSAHAVPVQAVSARAANAIDPATVTEIVVHKFEQPATPGAPGNGLPQDTTGLTPLNNATFTATRVPGVDLTTNAGQQQAAAMTLGQAAALVAGLAPDASGTTGAGGDPPGVTVLAPLGVGLYYVTETVTPAGYVGAAPFVVALPLTHPTALDSRLATVHVYPKNVPIHIELDVIDADAVALGDAVRWISRADIPAEGIIDGFRVVQQLDPKLELIDDGQHVHLGISAPGAPALVAGIDYTITVSPDRRTLTVDLTEAGRAVLAAHPGAQLLTDFRTRVLGEGELVTTSLLYPSRASIDGGPGAPAPLTASNRTKWGPLSVLVHEQGNPANVIPGACFKIYTSEADAIAGQHPVTVDGVSQWVTDSAGRLIVNGLRFSGFANGLDREPSDPLYRLYWVVPSCVPPGWAWTDTRPLPGAVNSSLDSQTLVFRIESTDDLPVTGGQIAGAGILGTLLMAGGALLVLRRRRRAAR